MLAPFWVTMTSLAAAGNWKLIVADTASVLALPVRQPVNPARGSVTAPCWTVVPMMVSPVGSWIVHLDE